MQLKGLNHDTQPGVLLVSHYLFVTQIFQASLPMEASGAPNIYVHINFTGSDSIIYSIHFNGSDFIHLISLI